MRKKLPDNLTQRQRVLFCQHDSGTDILFIHYNGDTNHQTHKTKRLRVYEANYSKNLEFKLNCISAHEAPHGTRLEHLLTHENFEGFVFVLVLYVYV